ncbi:UDP-N-acetylmuramoyl-L-alanyl-D-glutamate--2,6-diaminopimelate ligase [Paenibacillus sp. 481]|uniref:UDP-N-acetylmuramoyl-L-alanyl-D-glutamate--2, 6-diaminopimelate ligase n=1 Tax=Paenibacillus sp. 481 TaxID=2835869 RepID=UPI001E63645C|nr:UDP-N-acetylmuramoyl-L-alanyl-D-glutamate--2,6-diaminopimelate ligase [Paenibacillus sp. 481]UHA73554.1 UDP-N-acetylmuramoyl-L-alanyl-D-glutamate--2,6-diaminopimelate ligase [Paenibacillus sp. 481]
MQPIKLSTLLEWLLIKHIKGDPHIPIHGLSVHSTQVQPGDLFFCLTGTQTDGHQFAIEAVARGCAAIVSSKKLDYIPVGITQIIVPDSRKAMAMVADKFYGHPTRSLKLIGVTGTNGKTTTTSMIEKILSDNDRACGLIGTMAMKLGALTEKTAHTTPDAIQLQQYLKKLVDCGAEYAALEVSSHALSMGRVRGCHFKTVVFTNLTHDHLDYHHHMDRYFQDKALLFAQLGNAYSDNVQVAVINADDPVSARLASMTAAQVITYGIHQTADVQATDISVGPDYTEFTVLSYKGKMSIRMNMIGEFNVYNALAAITVCLIENIALSAIKQSLESFTGVQGRFESVDAGQSYRVVVDYAHNPDGLEKVLSTARHLTSGRLITLVGCEGDRDKLKRPLMASKAAALSDLVILTSDNPRSEHPEAILNEMVQGLNVQQLSRCLLIADRREAIKQAIQAAEGDDCVMITGKGHETHQIFADRLVPFNDVEIAREMMEL